MKTNIKKILIANRGEIALRVINACQEMNIATLAIYSEADKKALHVIAADQAVEIGPPSPQESYLCIDKIIKIAQKYHCDAIHPGYGFLSENPDFAQSCKDADILFIGPEAEVMKTVGDKLTARKAMKAAGIPIIPGTAILTKDIRKIAENAETIGYPIIIKASAGGGGKGMRLVKDGSELQAALEAGQREALGAFGNDTVYIEKFIEQPRHIEFQVLADKYGNIIHLFERECSIQRRHQKIIEETPSMALDDQLREKMGKIACQVMKAVNYSTAGTVEFLLDQDKNFYFLEVNARIQVEHPVTELVTGVDLVKQQIRLAAGEKLSFQQSDLRQRGHAIECRIYAEDPEENFLPSTGKLLLLREPQGPGIRCDSGIYQGLEITHYYDPILSKLIVWDENRSSALQKMKTALSNYIILGIKTPIDFLKDLLQHKKFISGQFDTGFIEKYFAKWKPLASPKYFDAALLIAAYATEHQQISTISAEEKKDETPWQNIGEWEMLSSPSK